MLNREVLAAAMNLKQMTSLKNSQISTFQKILNKIVGPISQLLGVNEALLIN
jgi:hypothetical protein